MEWSTACPDWERRIVAGESLIPFAPLFPEQADAALNVFRELCVVDVAGSPLTGEISREWLIDFVASIFGAYDAETGRRLIREFFLLISKKNAKSTTAAGVMLTALILNWRMSGEYLILAPTIEIANNSFFPARDMVNADDELKDLMLVQEHYRTITNRRTGATLKIVAADNEAVSGKKAIGVLVDELWLFGKRAGAENMLREATGGLASRPEGFTIFLSTQSDEPPAGVFAQKLSYARKVRDGVIQDKRFLPLLYEFPAKMVEQKAYREKANFYVTNPNLGSSVDPEYLERELAKADEGGEQSLRGFYAKHLNVQIGLAIGISSWSGALFWEAQGDRSLTLAALFERCEVIVVGIDGGGLDDLLGLVVMGREIGTGNWLHWAHAWAHPIVLERRKDIAPRLLDFKNDGDLTIVEKVGDDIDGVAAIVEECELTGLLDRIGVDVAGIDMIVEALLAERVDEDGNEIDPILFDNERIVAISQGWKLVGPIKATERKLAAGTFIHGDTQLMNFCVGNAKVEPKGNAVTITKAVAGTAKIDPLMATLNAVTLLALNPAPRRSVYESRGILEFEQ